MCLERLSSTTSECSCKTEASKDKMRSTRGSEETLVFELSRTVSNYTGSQLSKISEEDLKFTKGILDDYLYDIDPFKEDVSISINNR